MLREFNRIFDKDLVEVCKSKWSDIVPRLLQIDIEEGSKTCSVLEYGDIEITEGKTTIMIIIIQYGNHIIEFRDVIAIVGLVYCLPDVRVTVDHTKIITIVDVSKTYRLMKFLSSCN